MTSRIIFTTLILSITKAYGQWPGIDKPPIYEFTIRECFKNLKYSGKFFTDSLKPNNVLMGRRFWRTISLENKQNQLLFSSGTDCSQIGFFEIIKFGLFEKKLNAFFSDDFNNVIKNRCNGEQLLKKITYKDSSEIVKFDAEGNEKKTIAVEKRYLLNKDIKTYLLKEDWIFNNYSGQLEKKIIAIAPLVFDEPRKKTVPLFWLYYDEWKELFESFEAKNYYGEFLINFRDVLEKKYFVSVISKESNVFDRPIKSYKGGNDINMESELIKEKVLNSESDLFQY